DASAAALRRESARDPRAPGTAAHDAGDRRHGREGFQIEPAHPDPPRDGNQGRAQSARRRTEWKSRATAADRAAQRPEPCDAGESGADGYSAPAAARRAARGPADSATAAEIPGAAAARFAKTAAGAEAAAARPGPAAEKARTRSGSAAEK